LTESGSRTVLRLQAGDARRDSEDQMLQESCPEWLIDVVINHNLPKFIKIPFYLLPHPSSGIKPLRKDKLSASDMLQVRKVIEHVYEKMMIGSSGSEAGSTTGGETNNSNHNNDHRSKSSGPTSPASMSDADDRASAEERVQLLCQDQLLDPNMDLRTVKHFIWKSGGELILHYRPLRPS
jgi:WD repeat-containing protein 48